MDFYKRGILKFPFLSSNDCITGTMVENIQKKIIKTLVKVRILTRKERTRQEQCNALP